MNKITKITAAQFLSRTTPDKAFWCSDGKIFYNLLELSEGLKKMHPGTFSFHANAQKNDFSKWISDVIRDKKLADEMLKAKSKTAALENVKARVDYLKKLTK